MSHDRVLCPGFHRPGIAGPHERGAVSVSAYKLDVMITISDTSEQTIAALKALGYTNREIAVHYVSWAVAIALTGAVRLVRPGHRLDHGSPRPVAEEDRGRAVLPVDDFGQRLGANR